MMTRTATARSRLLAGLAVAAALGCAERKTDESAAPPPTARAARSLGVSDDAASGLDAPPTIVSAVPQALTPGAVALGNLSGKIRALERRQERVGDTLERRAELVSLLITRTQFTGSYDDFDAIAALAESAPDRFANQPRAHVLRARYRAAVHRFADADADLARAESLGERGLDGTRAGLRIAEGRELEWALSVATERARALPNLERLSLQASAEAALGRFAAADELYRRALASYHDVSPLPVAYVQFQRGVMWAEMADDAARALPLYTEAVALVPDYVVANVHLAELELEQGRAPNAEARLRRVAALTRDPEPLGKLGELLLAQGDGAGSELVARAEHGYGALLARYPAAFSDHAAEFFMGPGGKPARAVELSRMNLALRTTGRAHAIAIEAALAAGDVALACRSLEAARPSARTSRNLAALIEREAARCSALPARG